MDEDGIERKEYMKGTHAQLRLREESLAQRKEMEDRFRAKWEKEKGAKDAEGFLILLQRRFGSIVKAWRFMCKGKTGRMGKIKDTIE